MIRNFLIIMAILYLIPITYLIGKLAMILMKKDEEESQRDNLNNNQKKEKN